MEAAEVLSKVTEIVAEQANAGVETITPDTRLIADLGFDSLDVMETVMEVEDEFEISAGDEDLESLQSVRQISEYIVRKLSEAPAQ